MGSITTTFDKPDRILTIQGSSQGVFTDEGDNNPRHPTGEALSGIMTNNPLRAEHGWYTIDPTYSIGYLSSNSQIVINNIGLNNKELNAYNTKIDNATYANGVLSVNNLEIINSYFYNTNITCSGIDIKNNTKIDSVSANAENIKLASSSVADSTLQAISFDCSNTPLIDCSIFCSSGILADCDVQSEISQTSSTTGSLSITNCGFLQKSNISADILELLSSVIISGNVVSNTLKSASAQNILEPSSTTETNFFAGKISNSGVFSFASRSPLLSERPGIINYGRLMISATGDIELQNKSGICIVSSITITGSGAQTIGDRMSSPYPRTPGSPGTIFVYTINEAPGIIEGEFSFDKCRNNGSIRGENARFYEASSNYGNAEKIYFINSFNYGLVKNGYYSSGSINYGSGDIGEFYHNSKNMGTPEYCKFFDESENHGTISNSIFKNKSTNKAAGTGHLFYDESTNIGPLWEASFYNSGISSNASLINTNFYDTSSIAGATLLSGFINCYDQVSGLLPIAIISGIMSLYDTSYIKEINISTTSGILSLYDTSKVDKITATSGMISLYDKSIVTDLQAAATLYDSSICLKSTKLVTLRDNSSALSGNHSVIDAYDNSTISGSSITKMRLNDSSQLLSSLFVDGLIIGDAKLAKGVNATTALFVDGASTPSGVSNIANIMFSGGSMCDSQTRLSSEKVLLYNSNNLGIMTASNMISYCENSNNIGTGIGLAEFGPGSVNYGVILGDARFYIGSSNLGVVSKGYYHPSVTQTGISIQPGEINEGLEELECQPISFSFDGP